MSVACSRVWTDRVLKKLIKVWKPYASLIHITDWNRSSQPVLTQSQLQYFKQQCSYCTHTDETANEHEEDRLYKSLLKESTDQVDQEHGIFLIQPHIKCGHRRFSPETDINLKLQESCALINTLPNWTIIDKKIITVRNPEKSIFFGPGQFDELRQEIKQNPKITAVFVSVDYLRSLQVVEIQKNWRIPVFDRYTLVLQIFKLHAKSREAKIQIELAEIPYIRNRLRLLEETLHHSRQSGAMSYIGGSGETDMEIKKRVLQDKELKLKSLLVKADEQCTMLRINRKKKKIPIVAVVGYTNAGKTSLIKALTKDDKMKPQDLLFATLDVTVHSGRLPNGMLVFYIDTVGFIADIPTRLINAFNVTLKDALEADLIVHVRDISHPDTAAQRQTVISTLNKMIPDGLDNMIEVCNKADLIQSSEDIDSTSLYVSAKSGLGLDELQEHVTEKVMEITGYMRKKVKIPTDGEHLRWLRKEAAVQAMDLYDEDHYMVDIIIEHSKYEQFKKTFKKKPTR